MAKWKITIRGSIERNKDNDAGYPKIKINWYNGTVKTIQDDNDFVATLYDESDEILRNIKFLYENNSGIKNISIGKYINGNLEMDEIKGDS